MTIRLSTAQLFTSNNQAIQQNQLLYAQSQQKIASGVNLQSLSEDPVAASRLISLKQEIAASEAFNGNIAEARTRLEAQESTVSTLVNSLARAKEIAVALGNATLGDVERRAFSVELQEISEFVAGLANTKDSKGERMFAGTESDQDAYALVAGRYVYQGNEMERGYQVSQTQTVDTMDNGFEVFSTRETYSLRALGALGDVVDSVAVSDESALKNLIATTGVLTVQIDGGYNATVVDSVGNVVNDRFGAPMAGIFIDPVAGATLQLDGADVNLVQPAGPVPGEVQLRADFQRSNIMNDLLDMKDIVDTLSVANPADRPVIDAAQATFLDRIDNAVANMGNRYADLGGRILILDASETSNEDYAFAATKAASLIEDLDYAAATSELEQRKIALEASFASFAQIQSLSLFNYFR